MPAIVASGDSRPRILHGRLSFSVCHNARPTDSVNAERRAEFLGNLPPFLKRRLVEAGFAGGN
jgi:hypothetical protein